jgi:hypothetical protein
MVSEVELDQSTSGQPEGICPDDYLRLSEILISALPQDRKLMWGGKVMAYLARQTTQAVSEGQALPDIPTKSIHLDLGGNPNQEPSQWLSPIWKEIESRHYPEIEPTLIELSRQAGLKVYPALQKLNGKPALYRMATKTLPVGSQSSIISDANLPPDMIVYKRDLSLSLSWLGKVFFSRGLSWTPFKRYSFLAWQLLFLVSFVALDILLWLILWHSTPPMSGQELVVLAMAIGLPFGAYWHFHDIFRLFEDRIMIAPEWMLARKDFGATVELNRSKNPDEPSTILVQRYTATCPICGWLVNLDRGEPDFPRRIVGRCEESPREHVFSFDRSSKLGARLYLDDRPA